MTKYRRIWRPVQSLRDEVSKVIWEKELKPVSGKSITGKRTGKIPSKLQERLICGILSGTEKSVMLFKCHTLWIPPSTLPYTQENVWGNYCVFHSPASLTLCTSINWSADLQVYNLTVTSDPDSAACKSWRKYACKLTKKADEKDWKTNEGTHSHRSLLQHWLRLSLSLQEQTAFKMGRKYFSKSGIHT